MSSLVKACLEYSLVYDNLLVEHVPVNPFIEIGEPNVPAVDPVERAGLRYMCGFCGNFRYNAEIQ